MQKPEARALSLWPELTLLRFRVSGALHPCSWVRVPPVWSVGLSRETVPGRDFAAGMQRVGAAVPWCLP